MTRRWAILVLGVSVLSVAITGAPGEGRVSAQASIPLLTVAAVLFLQFVLIGAGKPAEYGRFGIFTNTALAIASATLLFAPGLPDRLITVRAVAGVLTVVWTAVAGAGYVHNFYRDTTATNSRVRMAEDFQTLPAGPKAILVPSDPAPYNCPPLDFRRTPVYRRFESIEGIAVSEETDGYFVRPDDHGRPPFWAPRVRGDQSVRILGGSWWATPISWANKPMYRNRIPTPLSPQPTSPR